MSLVESYDDLLRNIAGLEEARNGQGPIHDTYAELIGRARVMLPYLAQGEIAFAPSRFLGYAGNTVAGHGSLEERDGKKTDPQIQAILRRTFGLPIPKAEDEATKAHYWRFCEALGVEPTMAKKSFWITPEIAAWLDDHPTEPGPEDDDVAALEREVLEDASLPETTRDAIVKARIGQGLFRRRVLQAYGCCLATEIEEPTLLVASHIKPWRDCRTNPKECLDPDNALLLSPAWDRLFDQGYISFSDDGDLLISPELSKETRKALGVTKRRVELTRGQISYMAWHRELHDYE